MPYAIKVKKENAEAIRRKLVKKGLLDSRWSIVIDGEYLYLPVKEKVDGAIFMDLPKRKKRKSPYESIRELVGCPIPDYWEKIGEVALLPPYHYEDVKKVGEAFAKVLKAKTVAIYHGVEGEFRVPKIEVIYGKDTETVHVENGIKYMLDLAKVMFSSGNVEERIRMSRIDAKGEIVVDMFAGIGYFSLPLAKYAGAAKIYACEKNPIAYHYLLKNIEINEIHNIIPLLGDNREVAPKKVADRVLLGYVHTEPFLPVAMEALREEGGVIHYHDTFTTEERNWKPEENIKRYAAAHGFQARILYKRVIKSYAPHIWHIVVDARLFPKD